MSESQYNGIVIVDKPAGMTSHDVVHTMRKLFHTKRVGHTGTLDPDATGVLVICLGVATRLAEYLSAAHKNYVTEVVFGVETDTQDASGQVLAERDGSALTAEQLFSVLPRFRGAIEQIPPMVSALHHEGKRLYELARQGITVEREARPVRIERLDLLGFAPGEHPTASLEVTCSTGTYIRTLAADIGDAVGLGGMMRTLRRTWVGDEGRSFTLDEAHSLEDLRAHAEAGTLADVVRPISSALRGWLQVRPDGPILERLRHGQYIPLRELPELCEASILSNGDEPLVAVRDEAGEVCAIARLSEERLVPIKVLTQL